MTIHYNSKTGLLYLRLASGQQDIINKRVTEDIVLDMGSDDKIAGIEIMDASKHVDIEKLVPVVYLKAL